MLMVDIVLSLIDALSFDTALHFYYAFCVLLELKIKRGVHDRAKHKIILRYGQRTG